MIVTKWRKANPKIVSFWYDVDRVARQCIMTKKTYHLNGLEFSSDGKTFQIKLPSGRSLFIKPKIGVNMIRTYVYGDGLSNSGLR